MRKALSFSAVIAFVTAFAIIVITGCRKTDQKPAENIIVNKNHDKFFSISAETDQIVHDLAANVKKQDQHKSFKESLINRVGYPYWDRSIIAGTNGVRPAANKGGLTQTDGKRTIVYIPFARNGEARTSAILRVIADGNDTAFKMFYPHQYRLYGFGEKTGGKWNAKNLFHVFANFDRELFGTTRYLVKDGRIFGKSKKDSLIVTVESLKNKSDQVAGKMIDVTVCNTTKACVYASETTTAELEVPNCTYTTTCTTYWFDDGSGSGTGFDTGSGGGGGSSGSGEDWPDEPCENDPVLVARAEPTDHGDTGSPCGETPWEPAEDDIYNEVKDPCIRSMVQEAISKDCKNQITTFINSTFDKNPTMDITFVDAPLGNMVVGDGTTVAHIGGSGTCYITVTLNSSPGALPSASKEYIAATIFHESVHAWIDATNTLNNSSNSVSHETMASASNIDMLATALREMYPALSLQDAKDLAWGGLQKTTAWEALSQADKDRINQTNFDYKNGTKGTPCIN